MNLAELIPRKVVHMLVVKRSTLTRLRTFVLASPTRLRSPTLGEMACVAQTEMGPTTSWLLTRLLLPVARSVQRRVQLSPLPFLQPVCRRKLRLVAVLTTPYGLVTDSVTPILITRKNVAGTAATVVARHVPTGLNRRAVLLAIHASIPWHQFRRHHLQVSQHTRRHLYQRHPNHRMNQHPRQANRQLLNQRKTHQIAKTASRGIDHARREIVIGSAVRAIIGAEKEVVMVHMRTIAVQWRVGLASNLSSCGTRKTIVQVGGQGDTTYISFNL